MATHFPDVKHNLTATAAPAATDDGASGYREGVSRWINTVTGTEYRCIDATVGAARWAVDLQAGVPSVAGLRTALGGLISTPSRSVLREQFTKRPFLAADVTFLTDSSGGTASVTTLADQNDAVTGVDGTGSNAAGKTDVDARLVTIAHNVATLALKLKNVMQANQDFEVAGTNMTSALVTLNSARGGVRLTTAGAASDQALLQPRVTNANDTRWATGFNTDQSPQWACAFRVTSVAAIKIKVALALTNTMDLGTDTDQVGIYFDAASYTYFKTFTSIGGTDSSVATTDGDTTVAPAANTEYRVRIELDASRRASIYINDVLALQTAALTTNIALKPFIGIESSSGAKVIDVRPMTASIVEV